MQNDEEGKYGMKDPTESISKFCDEENQGSSKSAYKEYSQDNNPEKKWGSH